jgi:hypothetical protein
MQMGNLSAKTSPSYNLFPNKIIRMKQINIDTDNHKNLNRSTKKETPWLETAKPQPASSGNKDLKNQLTARPKLMLVFLTLLCGFLTFIALQSPSVPEVVTHY